MAIPYGTGRWLTRSQYQKIRNKAKELGAHSEEINLSVMFHSVSFDHITVTFGFKPFQSFANFDNGNTWQGFELTPEIAEKIKDDMDRALKFISFLSEFQ